jgi:hypothetical protein
MPGANVTIGGTNCVGVTVHSSKKITCTTPPRAAGNAYVRVINTDGEVSFPKIFGYY